MEKTKKEILIKEQEQLRQEIKPLINSITKLGDKWCNDGIYFYKWYNGLHVGDKMVDKIRKGLQSLKDDVNIFSKKDIDAAYDKGFKDGISSNIIP